MNKIKATLVIAFYNKVRFLELLLAGLSRQTFKDFEVLIADDGSTEANVALVKNLIPKYSFPIKHLWHEDDGFRKNIMLNKCVIAARGDVIIIVDGDCIPHSCFIEEHMNSTHDGTCSTGRRVNLSQPMSDKLTPELVAQGYLEHSNIKMMLYNLKGEGNHAGQGLYFKNKLIRSLINKKIRGVLGSNFSVTKNDLVAVNGFDERYVHPSVGEDTDIEYRLRLNGVKVASLINVAVQYHLYHKELPRHNVNFELLESTKKLGLAKTPFGINKLRKD